MVHAVKEFHPNTDIIVCGDFNRSPKHADILAKQFNLVRTKLASPLNEQWTRTQRRQNNTSKATLDYFFTGKDSTHRIGEKSEWSDHIMITTDTSISSMGDYRNMEEDRRIKAGTSLKVIAHIMM